VTANNTAANEQAARSVGLMRLCFLYSGGVLSRVGGSAMDRAMAASGGWLFPFSMIVREAAGGQFFHRSLFRV
jgi:hypothetical protein